VLERIEPHDWTLQVTVNLRPQTSFDLKTRMPDRTAFDFTSAAIVFPMLTETASSVSNQNGMGGTLSLNDRVVLDKPTTYLAADYPCGTRLGKWEISKDWRGEEVQLQVTLPITCYQTKFDEAGAMLLQWPETWPALAQSTFKPQLFIDLMPDDHGNAAPVDMEPIQKLIKKWTDGKDPKKLPPAQLAKFLCGKVAEYTQVSGNGLNAAVTAELEGFNLQGAVETALQARGNEFDLICLLTAVYRQAGIPCRTVIGWDVGEQKRDDKVLFNRKDGKKGPRGWVEVALPDPKGQGGLTWIPVDVVKIRKFSSRMQPLDKPWKYFGSHEELDGVIPIAFQFHPPTTVVAHGSPAMWGWMVTPRPPDQVIQAVRIMANSTSKTAESTRKTEEDRKKRGY